jgi:hypothetical protein
MKERERNSWNVEKEGLKKRRRKVRGGKDPRDVNMRQ